VRRIRIAVAIVSITAFAVAGCSSDNSGSGTTAAQTTAGQSTAAQTTAGATSAGATSGAATGTDTGSAASSSAPQITSGQATGAPASGGVFTIALANDPGNLDPSMTALSVTRLVSHLAYDTLVAYSSDGSVSSGLAKSWKVGKDNVVFTMVPDVTCSDGSPFTASVAADNINYVADPANKSPLLGAFVDPGTKAVGDDAKGTLTVTGPQPNAFMLNNLANVFMICKAGLADHSKLATQTLGTGPWVLSEAVAEDHYSYSKRDGYTWGPGGQTVTEPGSPDSVNVRVITNQTTAANLLLSGEVNMAMVTGGDSKRLDAADLVSVNVAAPAGETWFNQADGHPGADPKVREALATGTNLADIQKVATAGKGGASQGMVTLTPKPCATDTVTGNLPTFDPQKAQQLLEAAGWTVGADGIRVKDGKPLAMTFLFLPTLGSGITAGAELLAQQWKELGVQLNLKTITSTQINEIVFGSGAWDVAWISLGVNLPSQIVPFVSGPAVPNGTNFSAIENKDYTANATKAAVAGADQACDLWDAAEKALFTSFDLVPMYDLYTSTYFKNGTATISGGEIWGSSLRLTTG